MAKLNRKIQKIFALNAPQVSGDGTIVYGSIADNNIQYSKDLDEIQSDKWELGQTPALVMENIPTKEDYNSLFYVLSYQIAYILQNGLAEWKNTETYYQGSKCKTIRIVNDELEYKEWISKIDNNINHNPLDDEDEEYWQPFKTGGDGASYSGMMFDLVKKDHRLTYEESFGLQQLGTYVYKDGISGVRYGYPDFVNKVITEFDDPNNITRTITVGSDTVTITMNTNGHEFYDIQDKAIIDNLYNDKKVAWYYGVDKTNNRIFLPRNDFIGNIDNKKVIGDGETAIGLETVQNEETHTTGQLAGDNYATRYLGYHRGTTMVYSMNISSNSDYTHIQTEQVQQLFIYMVVATNIEQQAIGEYVDITNSENDNIPLGFSIYTADFQNSSAWLKSLGQWNNGNVYTTFYNYAVNNIGNSFGVGQVKEYTETYDDYDLVVNQNDITFRLPILNGNEPATIPTGIYLFYKVGNALQNIQLLNIAQIQNDISDLKSNNYCLEQYINGTEGYEIYLIKGKKMCRQWGYLGDSTWSGKTITLLKSYKSTEFNIVSSVKSNANSVNFRVLITDNSTIDFARAGSANVTGWWQTYGEIE